jgi:hypothetical protein
VPRDAEEVEVDLVPMEGKVSFFEFHVLTKFLNNIFGRNFFQKKYKSDQISQQYFWEDFFPKKVRVI